jgi:NDP-sugar pyrophosphorylase family protein
MKVSISLRKKVTRLKSYVFNNLKSLLITRCRSIAEIIPEQYRFFGLEEIILTVGHMSQLFRPFIQDDGNQGIKISFHRSMKKLFI